MKQYLIIVGLITTLASHAQTLKWGLSDASILFPLPEKIESEELLNASSIGEQGPLLPKSIYDQLPKLADHENADKLYSTLRAVAVRIEPLKKEIRIVYQPLEKGFFPGEENLTRAKDMAVHAFYRISRIELEKFLNSYNQIRHENGVIGLMAGLGTHPKLLEEKLNGPFSISLKKLILKSVGKQKMYRVTFMRLESIGGIWKFGGFDIRADKLTPFKIPRIGSTTQMFTNVGRGSFISGDIDPAPKGEDTFNSVLEEKIKGSADAQLLIKEIKAAVRVEDPEVHTTETMDCVSCHTARLARHWAFNKYPEIMNSEIWPKFESTDGLTLNNMRIFGYLEEKPSIAQRVINETAEIVQKYNSASN